MRRGDLVLEIGAGSGQLTVGLLRAGLRVHALEPGLRLAERLRAKAGMDAQLEVFTVPFEDHDGAAAYAAVFAANSFHWLDPAVSYRKTHGLLRPAGALCTLWDFPIAADPAVQERLNRIAFDDDEALQQFRREPADHERNVRRLIAEGHEELAGTKLFDLVWWELRVERADLTGVGYADLLASQANGAALAGTIRERVARVLQPGETIAIADHVAIGVARRRG